MKDNQRNNKAIDKKETKSTNKCLKNQTRINQQRQTIQIIQNPQKQHPDHSKQTMTKHPDNSTIIKIKSKLKQTINLKQTNHNK